MKKFLVLILMSSLAFLAACSSDDEKKKKYPERGGSSELPWDRPASWEGGLPGMGGIGTTPRF